MSGVRVGLCGALCLLAASAHASEPGRLILDPPQLWFGAAQAPAGATDGALSERQIDWLTFGADALLEVGVSAAETGLLFFGSGLASLGNAGGDVSILAVGLVLLLHPILDAFLVDAVARVSRRFQPNYLATLGGAYLGCLLGVGGFALAVVALQSWPVVELIVASTLNALLPAAGAALAEIWSKQPVERPSGTAERAAPTDSSGAQANQVAWQTATADPIARWTF